MDTNNSSPIISAGGTIVASIMSIVIFIVVSIIASTILTAFQYYIANVRMEISQFLGAIFGGYAGVYASRASCDAVIKIYSLRVIFGVFAALSAIILIGEFYTDGLTWAAVIPFAQAGSILISSWLVFWKDEF